jgi:hypothetical protein
MLIVGELQDGLVFDPAYKKVNGTSLTHLLVPLFAAQTRHRLIFLTKATTIEHALELPPTPQVVFSWSVNAEYIGTTFEHGAPPPSARFEAARRMKEAGCGPSASGWTRWCRTRAGRRGTRRPSSASTRWSRRW